MTLSVMAVGWIYHTDKIPLLLSGSEVQLGKCDAVVWVVEAQLKFRTIFTV